MSFFFASEYGFGTRSFLSSYDSGEGVSSFLLEQNLFYGLLFCYYGFGFCYNVLLIRLGIYIIICYWIIIFIIIFIILEVFPFYYFFDKRNKKIFFKKVL